ncbi:MAG: mycofactocin glycosyltransferase [Solirubrobacteraceae bacterium]|nr:mycofactocin glycosyltransferase [Solirubrobacteraceae bacterium]
MSPPDRPGAAVIVPFAGSEARLEEMLARLGRLERRPGDEVVLVDNRADSDSGSSRAGPPGVRVLSAPDPSSSWHARDAGAGATEAEWLVFVDADTRPVPDLLDRYLAPPPDPDVGVLAGGIRDRGTGRTACDRYVSARAKMDQAVTLEHPYRPYAQTANCAVRRSAFAAVGGFAAGAGSSAAGDADLCWRLAEAGWRLESRPDALVDHENRTRFRDLYAQLARHGAGLAWLERRHPGSAPPPTGRDLVGRIPHYLAAAARAGDPEAAVFALVDLVCLYARDFGRLRGKGLRAGGR